MHKILDQHTSNNFFQRVRSSRKKSILPGLVIITAILGLFLVLWLFNSNFLSLDIGNMPIKQTTERLNYATLDKIGESFHFVSTTELLLIYKQDHNFFFKRCAKIGLDKKECEDILTILIQTIEKIDIK